MSTVLTEKNIETPWPELSDDLRTLRQNVSIKSSRNVRQGYEKDENKRGMYRSGVKLNVERNRLLTESYKATDEAIKLGSPIFANVIFW